MSSLRLVFAGTPEFALPALEALADSPHTIAAVLTQPDRPAGRGRVPSASPVKQRATELGLPVEQPPSLKPAAQWRKLEGLAPDLLVVVAYGLILPPEVLAVPKYGCLNIHASLLPRWRGAAPIQRALLAGDEQTGVTIMQMDEGLDTGDILSQERVPILPRDTAGSLHDTLARVGADTLMKVICDLSAGGVAPREQEEARACYAPKLEKSEAVLDWRQPAAALGRAVRAFNPWPVAETLLDGKRLRIWEACVLDSPAADAPGSVLEAGPDGIDVATGDGILRLLKVQLPGRKVLAAREFLNAVEVCGKHLGGTVAG